MNKKLSIIFCMVLISFVLVTANLGTFQQGDCVDIKTILNTSAVNISTISYPDSSTFSITNIHMTQQGKTFNYTFCNATELGYYIYDYFDIEGNVYSNNFEITPSGSGEINNSSGMIIVISILTILGLGIICLVTATRFKKTIPKVIFNSIAGVLFIISILYILVILTNITYGFTAIIEGYTNFWFIIKMATVIGITSLSIFVLWAVFNLYNIKRGLK